MRKELITREDSVYFEGMTSIRAVLDGYKNTGRKIIRILYDETKKSSKSKELSFLFDMGKTHGFDVVASSNSEIDNLTLGTSHGGFVAECTRRTIPELKADNIIKNGFYVLLEGIEDPYNFGYSIRSLYAAGADGIILPGRNWMSAAGVVCRSSAGASERIDMFICKDATEACDIFRKAGYKIVCAGIRDSVSMYEADLKKPLILITGGEKRGISRTTLERADVIVRIDYGRNYRGSLSTASAAAVLAFEILRQN